MTLPIHPKNIRVHMTRPQIINAMQEQVNSTGDWVTKKEVKKSLHALAALGKFELRNTGKFTFRSVFTMKKYCLPPRTMWTATKINGRPYIMKPCVAKTVIRTKLSQALYQHLENVD